MQRAQHRSDFVVKTHGDPWLLAETVRRAVFNIDKELPISNVTTMDELVDAALARSRFNGMALAALACCALLLAAIGIYGVLSYTVVQRTSEIAVRMAIGATPLQVARHITAEGAKLVFAGASAGLVGALLLRNLVAALLFGVTGFDPLTYAVAAGLLFSIALLACAGPSLRASKVDPAAALRT
jgi:putative ABC transport system permease protein